LGEIYSIGLELPPIVAPKWLWIQLDVLRLAWKVFSIKTIIYGKTNPSQDRLGREYGGGGGNCV
jgi:hypothetical protein